MKKILSVVLSFIMIFSVIPIASVSAAETEETTPRQELENLLEYYSTELNYTDEIWDYTGDSPIYETSNPQAYEDYYAAEQRAQELLQNEYVSDEEFEAMIEELKAKKLVMIRQETKDIYDYNSYIWMLDDALKDAWYSLYTEESYDAYRITFDKAANLVYHSVGQDFTIENYKAMIDECIKAYDSLVSRSNMTPRQELSELLYCYHKKLDYTAEEWDGNYTDEPQIYENYYAAEQKAQELLDSETTTDEEFEGIIEELKEKRLVMIRQEIEDMYDYNYQVLRLLDDEIKDVWYQTYTKESYEAYRAAFDKVLLNQMGKESTIEECKAMIDECIIAYDNLVRIDDMTSRQELSELLYYYDKELNYTAEEWDGKYTDEPQVYEDYYSAEKKARGLLNTSSATEEELRAMIETIKLKRLVMIRQETKDMCLFHFQVIELLDYYSPEYWCKVYTKESYDAYCEAYDKANALLLEESPYIEDYKTAIDEFMEAYDNLTRNSFAFTYGDIDKDGEVSVLDAIIAQKGVVGVNSFTDLGIKIADVDGDKDVTLKDAILIQKKTLRLVDEFPVGDSFSTTLRVSTTAPYDYCDATIK